MTRTDTTRTDMTRTDTAHRKWNETWQTAEGRLAWSRPEPDVVECAEAAFAAGARRALDLGCGIGRHAVALAGIGYEVDALDGSESGLAGLRQSLEESAVTLRTHHGLMTELPFADDSFDYLLTFNVIYHGDPEIVGAALDEIRRVVRPGGTLQLTMLSKRNVFFGKGTEVAPNTFIVPDADDDKVHPHFYCNAAELVALLAGFELKSLFDSEHKPGHWHWHAVAERL